MSKLVITRTYERKKRKYPTDDYSEKVAEREEEEGMSEVNKEFIGGVMWMLRDLWYQFLHCSCGSSATLQVLTSHTTDYPYKVLENDKRPLLLLTRWEPSDDDLDRLRFRISLTKKDDDLINGLFRWNGCCFPDCAASSLDTIRMSIIAIHLTTRMEGTMSVKDIDGDDLDTFAEAQFTISHKEDINGLQKHMKAHPNKYGPVNDFYVCKTHHRILEKRLHQLNDQISTHADDRDELIHNPMFLYRFIRCFREFNTQLIEPIPTVIEDIIFEYLLFVDHC
jgi:hypothetical protein